MTDGKCANCTFYYEPKEQCRRHPPRDVRWLDYHVAELIREIAWAQYHLAKMETPESPSHSMNQEATEQEGPRWPYADEDDWCGEFRERT